MKSGRFDRRLPGGAVRRAAAVCVLLLCAGTLLRGAAPATQPDDADPALWSQLKEIDARAAKIGSLSADFEQRKFTALLTQPLVSTGTVRIHGSIMRWDTLHPQPSVLYADRDEVRIYYPDQKTLEIYPMDQRLGELAASPLPRLDVLRAQFTFERIPTDSMDRTADPKRFLALRLIPRQASLREHVQEVRVLLDAEQAHITRAEITDSDGDRTVLSFSNVRLNADVGDLKLTVPADTRISHPLQGMDPDAQPRGRSK